MQLLSSMLVVLSILAVFAVVVYYWPDRPKPPGKKTGE